MSTLEPPSETPRRGLSKLRRNRNKDADKSDSNASLAPAQDDSNGGFRASIDGAIEKLKDRRRKSSDSRRASIDSTSNGGRQSKLPMQLSRKSLGKRPAKDDTSPSDSNTGLSERDIGLSPSPSELSLGLEGSGHSSLLTEDSDHDEKATRPTLSPHQSHAGYLTLSSPLINAQATSPVDPPPPIDESDSPESQETSVTTAPTLISSPPTQNRRRSPSDRFKGAFTLAKKKGAADTDSVSSAGSGGGSLKGASLGGRNKSDSLIGKKDAESTEHLPQVSLEDDKTRTGRSVTPKIIPPTSPIITHHPESPKNPDDPPKTFVTPPTPVIDQPSTLPQPLHTPNTPNAPNAPGTTTSTPASAVSSPTSLNTAASQRRKRTGTFTSSRLSNTITSSPLTPHIEEAKTPGGTLTASPPIGAGGFFSSVFSAAQSAANQFTNTINTSISQNQKPKTLQPDQTGVIGGEEVIPGPEDQSQQDTEPGAKRQLAVETLGKGDLSLSHLGISEGSATEVSPMTSQADLPRPIQSEKPATAEENAAARAVSDAYEQPIKQIITQATGDRPQSVTSADGSEIGTQTPSGRPRASSIKSKLSDRRKRTRGSSAATSGSAVAAAISSSTAGLANPAANGPGHRLTGFAVASSKRNKDFHQLFRSVPEDDYLIEDYSAALQRDILLHGRLYISEGHICFSSNILGWVTNLVISFDEVVSVEKKNTAMIFPNAIVIQTLHARNIFASLVARDSTYDLLIGIWKISHPNLKSSLNGVALEDASTGDKTEKAGSIASDEASDDGSEDEVYDEDEDDEDAGSFYEPTNGGSVAGSDVGDAAISRKASAAPMPAIPGQPVSASLDHAAPTVPGQSSAADFPGPATHAPTECTDEASHYPSKLTDVTIPAPLGKVYSLMFGPQSSSFMRTWLVDNQKSRELDFAPTPGGMDNTHKEFVYSYIKPLNAPVGPRQTKCIVTAKLEDFDLEKAVSIGCSTSTPDVPSGSVFETKTRYCLMWGPGNSTRFVASCTVEWSGKSWLKGPIEKGAGDGQIQYVKDLVASLRAAVATKAPPTRAGKKGGKSRRRAKSEAEEIDAVATVAHAKAETPAGWGIFEPARPFLEPIESILGPMISAQVVIGFLAFLLLYSWFWPSSRSTNKNIGFPITTPDRLAAYEEIWRREESELWDWLEDRVGFQDGIPVAKYGDGGAKADRQKVLARKAASKKLGGLEKEGRLNLGQVDDAIRVTEERLGALKEAVKRNKDKA